MATYTAVVHTGNCSMDYERWEAGATCGHKHRTIDSAQACLDKQQRMYCSRCGRPNCGKAGHRNDVTSATWYNHTCIHDNDGNCAYRRA